MKKIYLVLFVILSIFVFSCKDNLISDDLSSSQNSGVGQVKVFVKQSRLIGPDVSDVDWTVELYKGNDKYSGKNENGYYLFSGLSDGTYNITVSGKIDEVEKFTGSAVTTITNGNSVSVNVPIVATKNLNALIQSTGYATIKMDMSEELLDILYSMGEGVSLVARLFGIDDTNTDFDVTTNLTNVTYTETQELDSIDIFDNQQITFAYTDYNQPSPIQTTDIPAGYYNLSFVGLEEFGIKLKDNLVEIGDGLTTNIVLTQNDYELVENLSQIFYVDDEDGNHTKNENGGIEDYAGTSLSNPLGFRNIDRSISGGIIYLISDVNTYENSEKIIIIENSQLIASFGTDIFSIINNSSETFTFKNLTLENIKLTNTTGSGFYLENCVIDGSVILDTPIVQGSNTDSTVIMYKSSNLVIGQNFSGELGICLFPENWQLGDTVVTFENGKPDNANYYIIRESFDSQGNSLASKFYIDDNGKLAQYDAASQWVNFAWGDEKPYLITQTQAKNKTYTSIIDSSTGKDLNGFNGISTYDEENQTWYFIANGSDSSGNVSSLYKVSAPTEYTDSVEPEKIEVDGIPFDIVQAMDYDNGKLYLVSKPNGYDFTIIDVNDMSLSYYYAEVGPFENFYTDSITSLLVYGNNFYFATTLTDTNQPEQVATHSAIWKYTLSEDTSDNGYHLIPAESYVSGVGECPVPYYLTQYDDNLTIINSSFPENSTFRITDLYIDGTEVYGLLANYIEKEGEGSVGINDKNKSFMRGSVFKLEQNTSRQNNSSDPIMNATHLGLRNSFPLTLENLATAKQYFILPRKIVGILNKKLVIVDDGMVPDSNDCNVDRFALFDLAGEISETIDVGTSFTTEASVSSNKFFTFDPLFDAQ